MKYLFGIAAAMTALLSIVWLAIPARMLEQWGMRADPAAIYMSRRYGAGFVGYALILWLARAAGPSPARTAILAGGAAVTGVFAIVSLAGVLTGVAGPFAWSAFVIEAALAAGFGYYLATGR